MFARGNNLNQDLVSQRIQGAPSDGVPANQEVAAHRIADPAQHLGKYHETNELGGARDSAAN